MAKIIRLDDLPHMIDSHDTEWLDGPDPTWTSPILPSARTGGGND